MSTQGSSGTAWNSTNQGPSGPMNSFIGSGADAAGFQGGALNRLPPSTWGNRQDLSIGGSDPTANMRYANEGMPNAPYYQQRQLAGYYGAPMMSSNGVQDFGRWNWASQMQQPQQPGQPPPTPQPQPQPNPNPQPQPQNPQNPQPAPGSQYNTTPKSGTYSAPGYNGPAAGGDGTVNNRNAWWAAIANAQPTGATLPNWLTGGLTQR